MTEQFVRSDTSLRIALFLDASAIGGIEQYVTTLACELNKSPAVFACILLWKNYGNQQLLNRLEQSGCEVIDVAGSIKQILKVLQEHRINRLHSHGYKANIIGRLVSLKAGIRSIASHHNGDVGEGRVRLYTLLDQLTAFLSDNWAVSEPILKRLPNNAQLMPNFVSHLVNRNSLGKEVVFVGRLEQVKRPDRVLAIAKRCPELEFKIYGTGSLSSELEQACPANVLLMGFENSPEVIWKNAAICLICSDDEGLPLTALEAMANGVPVVSTRVGQLPKLISHEENGWLADTDEEFSNLIRSWISLLSQRRKQISANAVRTIQLSYSAGACMDRYLEAYQS